MPGGKADEGDVDDVDTAKREAKEEIGLPPDLVTVVTVLEPFLSKVSIQVIADWEENIIINSITIEFLMVVLLFPSSLYIPYIESNFQTISNNPHC